MKGKIMIIEDNPHWSSDLREYLEQDGFYVEVANNLDTALAKLQNELFHFITIDMQLDETNMDADKFEGWNILDVIKKLRIQSVSPVMLITGFGEHYLTLKNSKNVEAFFFMEKGEFDRIIFLEIINREVERRNLRFNNDYRGQ